VSVFSDKVAQVIRAIPQGRILSYGEVAVLAGRPGGARAVASALKTLEGIPWWRVTRRNGFLAPTVADAQSRRLMKEGVPVADGRATPKERHGGHRSSRSQRPG
jgi:methylated-DNA-protein-cysteine methyltransferase-like protein